MVEIPGAQNFSQENLYAQEITRFNPDARDILIHRGYAIYTLNGASIKSHREAGKNFMSQWHKPYQNFEELPSMRGVEVAMNVSNPYLPKSNNKTFEEQVALISHFSQELSSEIPGIVAIMGEAADYLEFALRHADTTLYMGSPQFLFGPENNLFSRYARTRTLIDNGNVAGVGFFHPDRGISVFHWPADNRIPTVYAVPLIVPIGKK